MDASPQNNWTTEARKVLEARCELINTRTCM